jgi:two-component system CheB/CheR fusion protein
LNVEIIKATSGEEALRATLNHSFALAILDVQMPGIDGYELSGVLRKTNENLEHTVSARTAELVRMVEALQTANAQLEARADQLRALTAKFTMAEHRERERVSKVLHDGLQQHLAIVKLKLVALLGWLERDDLRQEAREIKTILTEAIEMSRSLSADLSPPVLHEGGLAAGLQWLARWMQEKHDFKVDLAVEDRPELSEDVKILVFESVRELLFNAVKHAKVSSARMRLQRLDGNGLRITVRDAGVGFDAERLKPAREYGAGFGLFSIRERIGLIGGCFEIDSAIGKGSCFILTVPHSSAKVCTDCCQ